MKTSPFMKNLAEDPPQEGKKNIRIMVAKREGHY